MQNVNQLFRQKLESINSRLPARVRLISEQPSYSFHQLLEAAESKQAPQEDIPMFETISRKLFPQRFSQGIGSLASRTMRTTAERRDPSKYDQLIHQICQEYDMDPTLVKAVIKAESGYNPNAVSHAGAMGLMQLMPKTARSLGVNDPFDPEENIRGGVKYLKIQLDRFQGDIPLALAAYNAGPGRIERLNVTDLNKPEEMMKLPSGTQRYIRRILRDING
ncbi:MAG: lytic transglycosylase domain-containing protein [Clostridia bacterium]|jgi:hypothetical protein